MADALEIVLLVCLATVACVGTSLNSMTMYILMRNKTLRKKLTSVRWLMFGQALSECLVCCIGAPVMFANTLIGMGPLFTTIPFLCQLPELVGFGCGYVALWYQTIIALTRLAAVIVPNWYRHYIKYRITSIGLFLFPWLIGYIAYAVGALLQAYDIHPTPGTGTCVANEYDESSKAESRFASYLLADTFLHSWSPQLLGLSCYVVIYAKKWWTRWKKRKQVEPNFTVARGQTNPDGINLQELGPTVGWSHNGQETAGALATNHTAAPLQVAAVVKAHQRRKIKEQRDQKIKLLAIVCLVNIGLTFPNTGIVWGFNYYAYLADNAPVFARILDVMYFMAFPINPLLYIVVSKDFRQAFREIFCKVAG